MRQSNIELLRIIAMLMILLLHANYFALGDPSQEDVITSPFLSLGRVFAEQLCIIGVNVFVLISGWFGIKPSFKGFCSLMFQIFFWGVVILAGAFALRLPVPYRDVAKVFLFGGYYWFVVSYVLLYLLSPALNAFVEKASPSLLLTVILCYFSAECVYGWLIDSRVFAEGYTALSFIGLYLCARYLRLYPNKLTRASVWVDILVYVVMTLIPAAISFIGVRNNWIQFRPLFYISPFVIASSVAFFLIFTKFEFRSRVVNWIASSVFCVYLIHLHPIVVPYLLSALNSLSLHFCPLSYAGIVLALAMAFILVCAFADKLRILAWKGISSRVCHKTT